MSEGKDQEGTSAQDESPEGDAQDQPIENTEISVEGGRDESSPQDGVQGEALEGPLVMSLPELTFPQEQSASLVINYGDHEARVAYLLDGVPTEFFFDRTQDVSLVGNIYKGRVVRVLPGMQAAFVDIGLKQAAFLYIDDIAAKAQGSNTYSTLVGSTYTQTIDIESGRLIQQLLNEGQELMVQVSKDPISTKGARVTSNISIAGRHLVYIPRIDHIGVSRRISDEGERLRLKELLEELIPQGGGFVARTAAEDCSLDDLREDLNFLRQVWNDVLTRMESLTAPAPLYEDLDLPLKATRDLVTAQLKEIIIDHKEAYEKLKGFIQRFMPDYLDRIHLYTDLEPLFEAHGIEAEINRALSRKVWLPSGGYLIIDQTEALTSIDVNSGRFVGKYHFEETIYRTNIEAISEVVHQLQLRNLGGIIIIDLIDMERSSMRDRVYTAFVDALKRDRAKTHVSSISGLGLIEMTRKRVRDSLLRSFCDPCIYCQGTGFLKSPKTLIHEIYREINTSVDLLSGPQLCLEVHPLIAQHIDEGGQSILNDLEERLKMPIEVKANPQLHLERYRFFCVPL
jgi:ribonuclease G